MAKVASNTIEFAAGPVDVTAVTSYLDAKGDSVGDISINDARTIVLFGNLTQQFLADDPAFFGGVLGLQPYSPPDLATVLDAFPDYLAPYITKSRMKQWSQEVRFASNTEGRLSWVAGMYWQKTKATSDQSEPQPLLYPLAELAIGPTENVAFWFTGDLLPGDISYKQDTINNDSQLAAFADVTFDVTDRLSLIGGVRVARTKFEFATAQAGPWVGDPRSDFGDQKETPVTPKFSATYDIDGGVVYATAAKGFRIGGANPSLGSLGSCAAEVESRFGAGNDNPLTYDSDSVWSYEVGAKKSNIADRVSVAASVFRVEWTDIQNSVVLDCLFNYTDNLGEAVSQGFDLSLNAQVNDLLNLGADIGYVDAHFTTDTYSSGGSEPIDDSDQLLSMKDDSVGGPKWTAHLFADLQIPLSSTGGGSLYARTDYNYGSSYAIDPRSPGVFGSDNLLLGDTDPLHLVFARVGYRKDNWDISLFADNLFDADPRISRTDFAGAITSRTPRPRTVGVTITFAN